MSKMTFATQKGKAYYYNNIKDFICDDTKNIIGQLVKHSFEIGKQQTDAWENQIQELKKRLKEHGVDGDIIFEYDIVRLGKRIDVVLLIRHMVFVLEFKNGATVYKAIDAQQAEDYAIDIKNFHKESENLYVCPILIATNAPKWHKEQTIDCYQDKQVYLQRENIDSFVPKVSEISNKYGKDEKLDFKKWFNSSYYPTPTIIAAAIEAYTHHNLTDIARSEAGQKDIEKCDEEISKVIDYAKTNGKKCVCFVTGVPGAGKTLVGLNTAVQNLEKGKDNLSVYLSGNGPLVEVLREALLKSIKGADKKRPKENKQYKKGYTESSINALIQSSFAFKKDNINSADPIPEHILIFDEAQRVWDKDKMTRKHKDEMFSISEPHLLFQIMDRHKDWAVMICLVGLGQDIHDGEVGINEWFRCGIEDFKHWELFYSASIFDQIEDENIDKKMIVSCERCHEKSSLHLKTSIRSFRANKQCQFIDFLLNNQPVKSMEILNEIQDKYPVFVTRNINRAKEWVKKQVRGSQRCGMLACSSAQRLKPAGIYVPKDIDVKNWFLAPSDDLRSSNMLEVVASEFKVQGLEIDWGIVCWDADLRRNSKNTGWEHYAFKGTKWQSIKKENQQRYLINSYRVLLTRSRQGMVIYVPYGVDKEEDETRNKNYYDSIYDYLLSCGIKVIN